MITERAIQLRPKYKNLTGVSATKIWRAAGGDYVITLASIADAAARMGAVGDLAFQDGRGHYRLPEKVHVEFRVELDVAPVAGTTVELWWCPSRDQVTYRAGVTGGDAAYVGTALGTVAESKIQLMLLGAIPLTPDAAPTIQIMDFVFSPPARYGCPVVVNLGGQILEANDDEHRIIFTPLIKEDA